jgi:MFS family permease
MLTSLLGCSGWLTDKYGARIVGFLSFLSLIPSSICLRLVTSDSMGAKALLCALLVCIGIFLDATEPAGYVLMDDVLEDLQSKSGGKHDLKHIVARAFGVQNAAHYFGITIGPVIILALPTSGRLGAVGILLGCLSAVTALLWIWGVKDPVDLNGSGGGEDVLEMRPEIDMQREPQEPEISATDIGSRSLTV